MAKKNSVSVDIDINKVWKKFVKTRRSKKLKNILVEYYYPLVKKTALRISTKLNDVVQVDDITSFGIDGLYDAIGRYDLTRGVKFEHFASIRIVGAIYDNIRREDWIPRSVRIQKCKFDKIRDRLESVEKRNISENDILHDIFGEFASEKEVSKFYYNFLPSDILSIDFEGDSSNDFIKKGCNKYLIDESSQSSVDRNIIDDEFYNIFIKKHCSELESNIIYLYYFQDNQIKDISEKLNLSNSRISQIHKSALRKLKDVIGETCD